MPPVLSYVPTPRRYPTEKIVAGLVVAVVVVCVAVSGIWWLGLRKGDSTASLDPVAPPMSQAPMPEGECWHPGVSADQCPEFTGLDAALYVFKPADEDAADCIAIDSYTPEGFVEVHRCRFDDLDGMVFISRWESPEEAREAFIAFGYTFVERWSTDGDEMGDRYVVPTDFAITRQFDLHVDCYDDLPFCVEMVGFATEAGGRQDWTLLLSQFDALTPGEVQELNDALDS